MGITGSAFGYFVVSGEFSLQRIIYTRTNLLFRIAHTYFLSSISNLAFPIKDFLTKAVFSRSMQAYETNTTFH